jgi:hypothetical protein
MREREYECASVLGAPRDRTAGAGRHWCSRCITLVSVPISIVPVLAPAWHRYALGGRTAALIFRTGR